MGCVEKCAKNSLPVIGARRGANITPLRDSRRTHRTCVISHQERRRRADIICGDASLLRRRQRPRSWDHERPSRPVASNVIKGGLDVVERRLNSNGKREPSLLDEPSHFRKRFRFWFEQNPCIMPRSLREHRPHPLLLLDRLDGPADPPQFVEILNQRMNGSRVAERALAQTRRAASTRHPMWRS